MGLSGAIVAPARPLGLIQPREELSIDRSYGCPVQKGPKQYRMQLEALGCPAAWVPPKALQSYHHGESESQEGPHPVQSTAFQPWL